MPSSHLAAGVCAAPGCRVAEAKSAEAARRTQRLEAVLSLRARTPRKRSDADRFPAVSVPSQRKRTGAPPQRKRLAFHRHLETVVTRAFATAEPGPDEQRLAAPDPPLPPLPDASLRVAARGCAACRGFCCAAGGRKFAFVDTFTIRRVRDQLPDVQPAEWVQRYLALIPRRTYVQSCVFHGVHGCTLPRWMRSDKCNTYFCGPLDAFLRDEARAQSTDVRAFLAYDDGNGRLAGRFVRDQDPGPRSVPRL